MGSAFRPMPEILAVAGAAAALGAKMIRKGDVTFMLEQGTVVTVLPDGRQHLPRRR